MAWRICLLQTIYYKRIIQGGVESWKAVNPELAAEPSRNNDYQVITKAVLADRLRERLNAAGSSFRTSQLAKDLGLTPNVTGIAASAALSEGGARRKGNRSSKRKTMKRRSVAKKAKKHTRKH